MNARREPALLVQAMAEALEIRMLEESKGLIVWFVMFRPGIILESGSFPAPTVRSGHG
jgi:hypothetical protein